MQRLSESNVPQSAAKTESNDERSFRNFRVKCYCYIVITAVAWWCCSLLLIKLSSGSFWISRCVSSVYCCQPRGSPLTLRRCGTMYNSYLIIILRQGDCLAYNDIVTTDTSAWCHKAIIIQFIIDCISHPYLLKTNVVVRFTVHTPRVHAVCIYYWILKYKKLHSPKIGRYCTHNKSWI